LDLRKRDEVTGEWRKLRNEELNDKGVSLQFNTTMFDFIFAFYSSDMFRPLSGHHQALGYTIQLYIYLLILLTAIHYYCLYISMVTDTPCTVVFRVLVSSHMCLLWFLFPVWGCIQLVSPVRCVSSCPVLLVGRVVAFPVGLSLDVVWLVALSLDDY
jgi:hypothetical protein